MAAHQRLEHTYRVDLRVLLEDRHDDAVEHIGQRVRAAPAPWLLLLGRLRLGGQTVAGGPADGRPLDRDPPILRLILSFTIHKGADPGCAGRRLLFCHRPETPPARSRERGPVPVEAAPSGGRALRDRPDRPGIRFRRRRRAAPRPPAHQLPLLDVMLEVPHPHLDALFPDLRNFLLLPSISDEDRARVEERIAEIDQGRQELAAQAEARRLYDEHIERHDSYMETLHNTLDPSEIDYASYKELREQGLSLLKLPGLADADRDNIERTYDMNQQAKNITVHRRRRNDLQFEAEREPYRHFSRHLARHLEAATARDLHPYAAPGCDKIADLADKTLRNDRLTGEQHDRIDRFLSGYRDWHRAMNDISPSREQDRSQGMSW